jgi:CRP-like cAMP-binding protein
MLGNHFLETLSGRAAADLRQRLQPLDFVQGDILAEPDAPIARLIFPRSGLISIVVELDGGDQIETGLIGRRGALGGAAIFGAERHLHRAVCQLSGRAWSMRIADARELAATSAEFHELIFAQEQYLLAQARQFAGCNARHRIVQRLCSWLLRVYGETGGGELLVTQDSLAKMLGVQRASLSMFASQLQDDGLISYRRGRVHISDPSGLRDRACACYAALEQRREHVFAAQPHQRHVGADGRHGDRPADGRSAV